MLPPLPPRPSAPQVADPSVSRVKFGREVAAVRAHNDAWRARGVLVLDATFPVVTAAFAAPQLRPPPLLFGVRIDFTDYDHHPPSVTLVDPFSGRPLHAAETPTLLWRHVQRAAPNGDGVEYQVTTPPLVVEVPGRLPFVCMQGVREYHEYPSHSGDAWALYRGSNVGSLGYLLEQLASHGTGSISGYQFQIGFAVDLSRTPGDALPQSPALPERASGAGTSEGSDDE